MDEFIHCSNIIQIHTAISTYISVFGFETLYLRKSAQAPDAVWVGEQPVFYAALTWRVLQTKNRVNKTKDVHKEFKDLYVCMYFVCIPVGMYVHIWRAALWNISIVWDSTIDG